MPNLFGVEPNKGLKKFFANNGGECGAFSMAFVSLLRNKGIPARPIIMVRPDGSNHVWSDFYLEKYGWIPVDVTHKNANPNKDFFGKYSGEGVIYTKGFNLDIEGEGDIKIKSGLLQTFTIFYSGNKCEKKRKPKFNCIAEKL